VALTVTSHRLILVVRVRFLDGLFDSSCSCHGRMKQGSGTNGIVDVPITNAICCLFAVCLDLNAPWSWWDSALYSYSLVSSPRCSIPLPWWPP
jgi:hypothetical protein